MSTIVTRTGKGSALTWAEADANFNNLNNDKLESASLHAATSKATPVDADETVLMDSAASYSLKKLTWANLKATLKTYFDTLYATASTVASALTAFLGTANSWTAVQTPKTGTASQSTTTTFTYDPSTHGQVCTLTLTNAITCTLAASAGKIAAGTHYTLILKAGDTSARSFAKGATVLAPGATLPITSGTTTSGSWDVLHLVGVDSNTVAIVGSAADVR